MMAGMFGVMKLTSWYPSTSDIETTARKMNIPYQITSRVVERYVKHRDEYAGPVVEGVIHNQCLNRDSRKEIEEEIVDALFNCIVCSIKGQPVHPLVYAALRMAWNVLQKERKIL